ncbi:MAG: hypothetical protein RL701_489 [Pseudomonadota bacterium]|jgi:indole-3-glycerol phosphate synthase
MDRPCLTRSILNQRARPRGLPIIAEIKARGPHGEDLLRGRPVEELVHDYERAGALAISVVTGAWFGGTLALLERAARVTRLPILRKDFLGNRAALSRSKEHGASAVLLTARLHSDAALRKLVEHACDCELTPFVEVDDLLRLAGWSLPKSAVLAINNSDISTRERSSAGIERSICGLASARRTGAGAFVSASAIATPADARQLIDAGFDALLIGGALMRAPSVSQSLDAFGSALLGAVT